MNEEQALRLYRTFVKWAGAPRLGYPGASLPETWEAVAKEVRAIDAQNGNSGGEWPTPDLCAHPRLDEEGVCRSCGADRRGQ